MSTRTALPPPVGSCQDNPELKEKALGKWLELSRPKLLQQLRIANSSPYMRSLLKGVGEKEDDEASHFAPAVSRHVGRQTSDALTKASSSDLPKVPGLQRLDK